MIVTTTNDAWGAIHAAHSVLNEILTSSIGAPLTDEEFKAVDEADSFLRGLIEEPSDAGFKCTAT